MCDAPGSRRARCSRGCATPGSARCRARPPRCSHDGVRERISPNKLPAAPLGRDHRGRARGRPALDRDRDVRAHRGAARAGRAHARRARAAGAHRRLHRVRAALVHPVPHAARAARTGSRRSRARRTSSTPRRSGSRSGARVPSLQASWVKMGLDAATEALRWGVNDLGGTLMEESISRLAGSYHGVKLDPEDLVAAAHRAGRPGGRAHDALRRCAAATRWSRPRRDERARRSAAGSRPASSTPSRCARRRWSGRAPRRRVVHALTEERARREAAASAARLRAGAPRGPLDGVPVAWKDLFDIAGHADHGGAPRCAATRRRPRPTRPCRARWPPPGWSASARRT